MSRRIAAPPAVVWELLSSTTHWPAWGTSIRAVEPPDTTVRVGLRGTVSTAPGPRLPFEITAVEHGRSWSWRVAGVPATTHRVEPAGKGCVVTFGVPTWAAPYVLVCRHALRQLERLATDR